MNVYDFDGTVYAGDSTVDFYFFCLRKQPGILRVGGKQIKGFFLYKLKKIDKTQFKESFFSFLPLIKKKENMVKDFWILNEKKIRTWYWENKKKSDIIISASPEFLLFPVTEKLDIQDVIATKVDINTGKIDGKNCRGKEKVVRFQEKYKLEEIDNFYSDSDADLPLATIAKRAYKVKGMQVQGWKISISSS